MSIRGIRVLSASLTAAALCAGVSACSGKHHAADQQSRPGSSAPSTASTASTGGGSAPTKPSHGKTTAHGSGGGSKSAPSRNRSSGAEGATPAGAAQCRITAPGDVAAAFGGKVVTTSAGTSGIGNPICRFTLTKSNAGVPGTVSVTVDAKSSAKTFAQIKKSLPGATSVAGVGDSAFFVAGTSTVQFLKGSQAAVLQATLRAPGGPTPPAARVKSDLIVLAQSIAASM